MFIKLMGFFPRYSALQYHFITMMFLCKCDSHINYPRSQSKFSIIFIRDYIFDKTDATIFMREIWYVNNITGRYNFAVFNRTEVLDVWIILDLIPNSFALLHIALVIILIKLTIQRKQ